MEKNETIRIGVGAVVFRGDEVLLIKRARPPFEGCWSIPGGKLEYGENLAGALIREVREETGLEITVGALIGVFESFPDENGGAGHYVLIDYCADWVAGDPVAADDASDAAFFSFEEAIKRLSWDETRRAVAMAIEMRETVKDR